MEEEESSKMFGVGDTIDNFEKKSSAKIKTTFPWRALLLSLTQLAVCATIYYNGASQLVVRRDGSTTSKRLIKRRYKYLKYAHNLEMVPVLSMSLSSDPNLTAVSALSALGLLIAVIVAYMRQKRGNQNPGGDGQNEKPHRNGLFIFTTLLTVFGLLFSATDLICNISEGLHHAHLLILNVGSKEAISFLMATSALNGLQMFLWLGGLKFQKNLFLNWT